MFNNLRILIISTIISTMALAADGFFISEYTEADGGYHKYVEFYNGTGSDINLSDYQWGRTGNSAPGGWEDLYSFDGTVLAAGDVYVICNGQSDPTILPECDEFPSAANFNGDDAIGLFDSASNTLDAIGAVEGIDPGANANGITDPGSAWSWDGGQTRNGTLVRNADVSDGNDGIWVGNESQWTYAAGNLTWDNLGSHTCDACSGGATTGCTTDAECADESDYTVDSCTDGACTYVTLDCLSNTDCDDSNSCTTGTCEQDNTCSYENLADDSVCDDDDGWTSSDVCTSGVCAGMPLSTVEVTFNLDLNIVGANSPQVRVSYGCVSGCDGDYNSSVDEWLYNEYEDMTDGDLDGVWSYTVALATGVDYTYAYKNGGYEDGDFGVAEGCSDGDYGSWRHVTPGDTDMNLDPVCWSSCSACPVNDIEGCTDSSACNYNPDATVSTDTCQVLDCTDTCGGTAVEDTCGICSGDGSTCSESTYDWEDEGTILGSYGSFGSASIVTETDDGTAPYLNNHLLKLVEDGGGTPHAYLAYVQDLSHGDEVTACFMTYDTTPGGSPSLRIWGGYLDADNNYAGSAGGNSSYGDGTGWSELCHTWTVASSAGCSDDTSVDETACLAAGAFWTDNTDRVGLNIHARLYSSSTDFVHYVDDLSVVTPSGATVMFPVAETCDDGVLNQDETDVDCGGSICGACCSNDGDANGDGIVNVSDVVAIVQGIIGNSTNDPCATDVNNDGLVDVSDIVAIVGWIIGGRTDVGYQATNADIIVTNNTISLNADGYIAGVQMTLSHGSDFSLELSDAYISEYSTRDNVTTLILVSGDVSLDNIATYKGSFDIESVIVTNSNQQIQDVNVLNLEPVELTIAGPNPFNPSTSLNVVVTDAGYVSVNVYNVVGQKVATLLNGYMDANVSGYKVDWNASDLSSGVYLVRAETAGSVSTQKLMLLK